MDLKNVSILWILVMSFELIGILFTFIGFGGNYIVVAENSNIHGGLWETCGTDECVKTSFVLLNTKRSKALNGIIGVSVAVGEGKRFFEDFSKGITYKVGWSFILFMIGQLIYLLAAVWHYFHSRNKITRRNPETAEI